MLTNRDVKEKFKLQLQTYRSEFDNWKRDSLPYINKMLTEKYAGAPDQIDEMSLKILTELNRLCGELIEIIRDYRSSTKLIHKELVELLVECCHIKYNTYRYLIDKKIEDLYPLILKKLAAEFEIISAYINCYPIENVTVQEGIYLGFQLYRAMVVMPARLNKPKKKFEILARYASRSCTHS